ERAGGAVPPVRRPARGPVRRHRLPSRPRGADPAGRRAGPHRVRAVRHLSRRGSHDHHPPGGGRRDHRPPPSPLLPRRLRRPRMTAPGPLEPSPIGAELLDDPSADPATVAASLRDIARANRWFGGAAAVRRGLRGVLAELPRGATVTLADL